MGGQPVRAAVNQQQRQREFRRVLQRPLSGLGELNRQAHRNPVVDERVVLVGGDHLRVAGKPRQFQPVGLRHLGVDAVHQAGQTHLDGGRRSGQPQPRGGRDHPGNRRAQPQGVVDHQIAAHAVPVQEDRHIRKVLLRGLQGAADIVEHGLVGRGMPARPGGLAVPAVVEAQHGEARRVERLRDVLVTPAVLAQPVHQADRGARRVLRCPGAGVKFQVVAGLDGEGWCGHWIYA